MAIQYAGGSRVNYTFTDAGTRADLVSKLETNLGTAGWSTISGAGTSDVLMKSAVTPDGLSVRVRLYDPGSGNCAQFTIKNNAGTLTSQTYWLLPASVGWRIVANKYSFYIFKRGAANRRTYRSVLMAGTIWVPSFVLTVMGSDLDCGYLIGTGDGDAGTGATYSWRNQLSDLLDPRGSTLWRSFMLNGTLSGQAYPLLAIANLSGYPDAQTTFEWEGGQRSIIEPLVGWSPDSTGATRNKFKGQLWDALIESGQQTGEATITFDGHTFIAITDVCDSLQAGTGTLYIAVD